jgi:hypothetical protein
MTVTAAATEVRGSTVTSCRVHHLTNDCHLGPLDRPAESRRPTIRPTRPMSGDSGRANVSAWPMAGWRTTSFVVVSPTESGLVLRLYASVATPDARSARRCDPHQRIRAAGTPMRSTGKCVSGSPLSLSHLRAAKHIKRYAWRPARSEGGAKRPGGSPQAGGLLRPALNGRASARAVGAGLARHRAHVLLGACRGCSSASEDAGPPPLAANLAGRHTSPGSAGLDPVDSDRYTGDRGARPNCTPVPLTLTGEPAVKPLLALLSLLKPNGRSRRQLASVEARGALEALIERCSGLSAAAVSAAGQLMGAAASSATSSLGKTAQYGEPPRPISYPTECARSRFPSAYGRRT